MAAVIAPALQSSSDPASCAFAPTPSDTVEEAVVSRAIYVGTGGDLKVVMWGSGTVTFVGVPSGTVLPIRVKQVYSTGTTASDLLILF